MHVLSCPTFEYLSRLQNYQGLQYIYYKMKSESNNRFTVQTENDYLTAESSKISRDSMTSEQRKMHECGMYFPEKVIYAAKVDQKVSNQWEESCPVKLTSQAFAAIPISTISKIKFYRNSPDKKLTLKISATSTDAFFNVGQQEAVEIFGMICWSKLATMNLFSDIEDKFESVIYGEIYKKSEVLKNWKKRYVTISKDKGLTSSKNDQSEPSLKIANTTEVWTRFETIHQQKYLVIKLWYGVIKEEFAVPVFGALKWIQAFCSLLSEKQ